MAPIKNVIFSVQELSSKIASDAGTTWNTSISIIIIKQQSNWLVEACIEYAKRTMKKMLQE